MKHQCPRCGAETIETFIEVIEEGLETREQFEIAQTCDCEVTNDEYDVFCDNHLSVMDQHVPSYVND